jgi:hypothetical protein
MLLQPFTVCLLALHNQLNMTSVSRTIYGYAHTLTLIPRRIGSFTGYFAAMSARTAQAVFTTCDFEVGVYTPVSHV